MLTLDCDRVNVGDMVYLTSRVRGRIYACQVLAGGIASDGASQAPVNKCCAKRENAAALQADWDREQQNMQCFGLTRTEVALLDAWYGRMLKDLPWGLRSLIMQRVEGDGLCGEVVVRAMADYIKRDLRGEPPAMLPPAEEGATAEAAQGPSGERQDEPAQPGGRAS